MTPDNPAHHKVLELSWRPRVVQLTAQPANVPNRIYGVGLVNALVSGVWVSLNFVTLA